MKKYTFIVEKTDTGYSAYAKDEKITAATTGSNLTEIKQNALEALNLLFNYQGKKEITASQIVVQMDIAQFFQYYKVINAKAFCERIGLNPQLLNHYLSGLKKPSPKQLEKIAQGLRDLGAELETLEFN